MKTKILVSILTAAILISAVAFAVAPAALVSADNSPFRGVPGGRGGTGTQPTGNGLGNTTSMGYGSGIHSAALTPLSEVEVNALQDAILEEYGALNLYNAVIAQYGSIYPFVGIARSEQAHVNVLVRQAVKYGVTVPTNPGLVETPTFATVQEACAAGVAAEIADAALYDDLKAVTTHTDLLTVYTNLQNASLNNHLPTFQACD